MAILEGLVSQHIIINFLNQLRPIFDVSFRRGLYFGLMPAGSAATNLVDVTELDTPQMTFNFDDVKLHLKAGTEFYKQMQIFYQNTIPDGCVLFMHEASATPAVADVSTGMGLLDDALSLADSNAAFGWPYLTFSNIPDATFGEAYVSEMADYIGTQERLYFTRPLRVANKTTMATAAKDLAVNTNSKRTVVTFHVGQDDDLDGVIDAEAYIDAAAASFIASLPVGGWEIFPHFPEGLAANSINETQRALAENGDVGTSGAICSANGFGVPAFSTNKTSSGTFVDVTQTEDFLNFKFKQAVWALWRNKNKIPYTESGFAQIAGAFREVLLANVENPANNLGIVRLVNGKPDFSVTPPKLDDIPLADRLNRHATPFNIDIGYTGSVLKITSNAVLRV